MMEPRNNTKLSVDSGMLVVIFICLMYMVLVFGLLFYVKNDWCDLLFKNMTVSIEFLLVTIFGPEYRIKRQFSGKC